MNYELKRNLLFGYGLAFFIVIGVLLGGTVNQFKLWNTCNSLIKTHLQNVMAAENMITTIDELNNISLQYATNSGNKLPDEISKSDARFAEWMKIAGENTSSQNEKDILSNMENDYSSFESSIAHLINIDDESRINRMSYYENNVQPSFAEVRSQCSQLRKIHIKKLSDACERAKSLSIKGIAFIVVFGVVVTVAGIFIFVFLARLRL